MTPDTTPVTAPTSAGNDAGVLAGVRIDASSSVPPYEQLRLQILDAVNEGRLAIGTRLPPVRALAGHLGLAVNTVAKAYRELEQAQVVTTRSRAGTVVAAGGDTGRGRVAEAAAAYAAAVRANGVSDDDAVSLLRAALG
ncbi:MULTISPECIES: GntR family transcriptional regulator [unclassified Arthrobacter]|uniref:GntR family transcriptional regulator n=1 Tax=unclassified Arthrobacter TaxID=235627 RepID=UPI002101F60B|nr:MULTISPECIES: GntR family transcriptional regulator [unclassified Arthrobacter]MCQ1946952.1 GntR family transcriptional regulator [Arthrobacter sp. zg-Y1116]MCQ1986896.1 GntR family transcriptional regulator [Arthrobacter sp. zg-Y844]MCQ1995561.1 GntR family transcriptional regulator [Arthrobacter sp. zg-Y1171]UWX80413.1 GntR family transcriptional regulator [Arthrobacter sp. zg-Y1171]